MTRGVPEETCGDHGGRRQSGRECGRPPGWGTDFQSGKCRDCRGTSPDGESHQNNDFAVSHGLYQSKETFLQNAEQHHKDTYYAIHESLCTDYELKHGRLPTHIKKRLADIALDMVRIDMGDEYEAEHAVDDGKPLTEMRKQMTEQGAWEKEMTSKIEKIKKDISKEMRLALKDMGIYQSPEQQQADATRDLGQVVAEALEPED